MGRQLVLRLVLLVLASTIPPQVASADPVPAWELAFGLGAGASAEKDIFNVSPDNKSTPDLLIQLGYRQNLNERLSWGIHLFGGTEETPQYAVISGTGPQVLKFDLFTYNMGPDVRYTFGRGAVQPYVTGAFNFAYGLVDNPSTGELSYRGFSLSAQPGVSVRLAGRFRLALEGLLSVGSARWSGRPFLNSSGEEFNPSLFGILGNLSAGFGSR